MWASLRQLGVALFPRTPLQRVPTHGLLVEATPLLFQTNRRELSSSSSSTILGSLSSWTNRTMRASLLQPWTNNNSLLGGLSDNNSPLGGGAYTIPSRGMKIKGKAKRRCKDCYLIWENGILYNRCKTHQRHKHMRKPAYWANQRILTHATSGFKRPW